jgi:hypothetical protein
MLIINRSEPELPRPLASFQEAGHARQGVVKNMEPLGTRPSTKLMKAVMRPDSMDTSARKSGPSFVSALNEGALSVATPEQVSAATPPISVVSIIKVDEIESRSPSAASVQSITSLPPSAAISPELSIEEMPSQVLTRTPIPLSRGSSVVPTQDVLNGRSSVTPVPDNRARSATPVPTGRARSETPLQLVNNRAPLITPLHVEIPRLSSASPIPGMLSGPSSAIEKPLSREASAAPVHVQPVRNLPVFITPVQIDASRQLSPTSVKEGSSQSPSALPNANVVTPDSPQFSMPIQSSKVVGVTAPSAPRTPQLQTSSLSRSSLPPAQQNPSRPSTAPQPYAALPSGQSVFSAKPPGSSPVVMFPPPPQVGPNGEYVSNLDHTDRVVESAVQQALDEQHYPTAYALRTLYDDFRANARMVRLIDDIYNSCADETQQDQFYNVMKLRKIEGKKDRTGEYYFNGDGSDPLPDSLPDPDFPSLPLDASRHTTPGMPGAMPTSENQVRRPSPAFSPISPFADDDQHINKKHKGNNFGSPAALAMDEDVEMNGCNPLENSGAPAVQTNGNSMERSLSQSSSSSLSSVDEALVASNLSLTNSPAHKTKLGSHHTNSAHTQPRFAPPNAEGHPSTGNQPQPITIKKKPGPKLGFFSVPKVKSEAPASNTPSSSTAAAQSSSAKNSAVASANHQSVPSHPAMPSATVSSPQPVPAPSKLRGKKDKEKDKTPQGTARSTHDVNDTASRLKRKVRETARENEGPVKESFERHQIPLLPEPGYASDGGYTVAVGASRGPRSRLRLTHNKKTRQSQSNNYESDQSSPPILPFHSDFAPGSLPGSRAGTPGALNRPTRKTKTGTGLRVKTS